MKFVRIATLVIAVVVTLAFGASLQAAVSFQSVLTWTDSLGHPVNSVAAGDITRDGKKDIFVGLDESVPSYTDAQIVTLVQGATPRTLFSLAARQTCAWKPTVFIKDLNGDGNNDLFYSRDITDYDFLGNILDYRGDWTRYISLAADANIVRSSSWSALNLGNMGGWFTGPAIIDLNQDGKVDLVRVRCKDGQVARYFGDGAGNFANLNSADYKDFMYFNYGMARPGEDLEQYPIAAGHLDATNSAAVNDIVTARMVDGKIYILFQHPVGVFNGSDTSYTVSPFSCGGYGSYANDLHLRPTHLGIGDFNHDGRNDVIVIREDGYVYICYQGTGSHDFTNANVVTLMCYGKKITDMKVADLQGNGYDDFVVARSNGDLYVNIQTAPGVFNNQLIGSFYTADPNVGLIHSIDVADMDNDGLKDIVVGLTDGRIFTFYQQPPTCSQNIPGDVTGDCMVDFRDVNVLTQQWLQTTSGAPYLTADINTDGTVNLKDIAVIASHWMQCNLVIQSNCWQ